MKIKALTIPLFLLFAISCQKSKDTSSTNTTPPASYLTTSSGSSWNYQEIDSSNATPVTSNYTVTSSAKDTSINSKTYHVYNLSSGGNQYLCKSGNNYYQYDSLPAGLSTGVFERLYLEDAPVSTSWSQTLSVTVSGIPFPVPVTLSYQIAETNVTMVVNNITYSNVIHVSGTVSSSLIPAASLTSSLDSYYAPKYGLIESSTKINLDYMGLVEKVNIFIKLTSSSLI